MLHGKQAKTQMKRILSEKLMTIDRKNTKIHGEGPNVLLEGRN